MYQTKSLRSVEIDFCVDLLDDGIRRQENAVLNGFLSFVPSFSTPEFDMPALPDPYDFFVEGGERFESRR